MGFDRLGINPDRIRALAPDAPLDSWSLLLTPPGHNGSHRVGSQCWIRRSMWSRQCCITWAAVRMPRHRPDFDAVAKTLLAIRPYIREFASGGALEALATGQSCLALDYSGDVSQASARAKDGVVVPTSRRRKASRSASTCWLCRPTLRYKDAALAFIDFVLRPEIMARITDATHYPNAVPVTGRWCGGNCWTIPTSFHDAMLRRSFTIGPSTPATDRLPHPALGTFQGSS